MNRKITRHILYFVKGAGGGGGGGGAQGRPGTCNANGLAQAEQTLLQHNHSSQSKGLWGAEMRQDREQKNVIYKASADWNLSSDPLAAAQLICSWFQTTPPGRPEGTFFRFYAWIYLFNSPFTKTTADDRQTSHSGENRRTHTLSHRRTPGTQASESRRHRHCSAQARRLWEGRMEGKTARGASLCGLTERTMCSKLGFRAHA